MSQFFDKLWNDIAQASAHDNRSAFLFYDDLMCQIVYSVSDKYQQLVWQYLRITAQNVSSPLRYGFRTHSSGSLRFRMNAVHMSKAFLHSSSTSTSSSGRRMNRQFLLDRLTAATLFSSVSTVMAAFEKARERSVLFHHSLILLFYSPLHLFS